MAEHDEDMKRWDRIERILQTAIDQESAGTETGLRHFKSANVILRALGGIAGEADWSELVRLLMVDALYTRLEIMMRAAGGVPDDEESVHLLRHWQQRLQ